MKNLSKNLSVLVNNATVSRIEISSKLREHDFAENSENIRVNLRRWRTIVDRKIGKHRMKTQSRNDRGLNPPESTVLTAKIQTSFITSINFRRFPSYASLDFALQSVELESSFLVYGVPGPTELFAALKVETSTN